MEHYSGREFHRLDFAISNTDFFRAQLTVLCFVLDVFSPNRVSASSPSLLLHGYWLYFQGKVYQLV